MKKPKAILALILTAGIGSSMAQMENETKRQDPMPNMKTTVPAPEQEKKDTNRESETPRKKAHKRHKKSKHKAKKSEKAEAVEHEMNPGV